MKHPGLGFLLVTLALLSSGACDDSNLLGAVGGSSGEGAAPGGTGQGGAVAGNGFGGKAGAGTGGISPGGSSSAGVSGSMAGAAAGNPAGGSPASSGAGGMPSSAANGGFNLEPAAGNSGEAGAGGASELCGGKVCVTGDVCCGPPSCGTCINALSGADCPNECPPSSCVVSGDCRSKVTNAEEKLADARRCSGSQDSCRTLVEGVCCPQNVDNIDSPEAQCALAAIADAKAAGCVCLSAAPCVTPSDPGECVLSGVSTGVCR